MTFQQKTGRRAVVKVVREAHNATRFLLPDTMAVSVELGLF
jgi:hypothetical protein